MTEKDLSGFIGWMQGVNYDTFLGIMSLKRDDYSMGLFQKFRDDFVRYYISRDTVYRRILVTAWENEKIRRKNNE